MNSEGILYNGCMDKCPNNTPQLWLNDWWILYDLNCVIMKHQTFRFLEF